MGNKQYEINYDLPSPSGINAKLRYISNARYETDWHSIMHSHPCTELFYVLKGEGRFFIENNIFEVKEDDLVIINANVSHTEASKDNAPLEYIVIGIDEISFISDGAKEGGYYSLHNYYDYKQDVRFYLKNLLQEAQTKSKYYEILLQSLLNILIVNIIRRTDTKLTVTGSKELVSNCAFVKNYIDDHYMEDINLDALCRVSYMNKFYLIHAFKKYTGMTPVAYIHSLRLKKASFLLKNTDHSIAEIANFIGMSSQSYFAQAFKKAYRISPMLYRKYNKKPQQKTKET